MAFTAVVALTSLDGTTGSQITGEAASNYAGQSISSVGDINGDGIDDFAIGATGVGGSSQGAVYVVFGTASGFPANFSLTTLNGANGFQINGGEYAQDFVGVSVFGGGDVNNDGIDDLIIGASGADPDGGGSGAAYVLFGKDTAVSGNFATDIATSSLTGTTGFQISGTNGGDGLGFSVSMGDFNGDGIDDMLVGANQADGYRGAAYVIFGKGDGFAGNIDVATLDGTNGFKMPAGGPYDYVGTSVANAGDVNGDGIDDIIVSAMGADPNGSNSGAVYVVFGKTTGFTASVSLTGLSGADGFRISGMMAGDQSGISVSAAGDVNDDGVDDLLIGANGLTNNGGAFVVFGRNTGVVGNFAGNLNLSTLDGTNGFRIDGELSGDNLGIRVSNLGDVNGDGIDDFGVGATGSDVSGSNSGAAYVIFGSSAGFGATLSLAGLNGTNGFQINGEAAGDNLSRIAGVGDYNNDGAMDVLVGTSFNDAGGNNAGAAWIIYGIPAIPSGPTEGDDSLDGAAGADTISGLGGKDVINGLGGDDILDGGAANDILNGGLGADDLVGGLGNDILNGDDGDDQLNGGDGSDKLNGGIGADQLTGGAGADQMSGGDGADTLFGNADNDLLDGGAGADTMTGGTGNDVFIVDDAGDQTIEAAGEGYDIVRTALDGWVLGANLEGLELQGSADIDGTGNSGANNIQGNDGANTLYGLAGVDTINGNDGDDIIVGGAGSDLLRGGGGGGTDTFVILQESVGNAVLESDTVYDYFAGDNDSIDLSDIDADSTQGGNQAFTFAEFGFTKTAGEMTLTFASGQTTLRLDVNGDGKADYQMKINGDVTHESAGWAL
jgi:hypothetical protein